MLSPGGRGIPVGQRQPLPGPAGHVGKLGSWAEACDPEPAKQKRAYDQTQSKCTPRSIWFSLLVVCWYPNSHPFLTPFQIWSQRKFRLTLPNPFQIPLVYQRSNLLVNLPHPCFHQIIVNGFLSSWLFFFFYFLSLLKNKEPEEMFYSLTIQCWKVLPFHQLCILCFILKTVTSVLGQKVMSNCCIFQTL